MPKGLSPTRWPSGASVVTRTSTVWSACRDSTCHPGQPLVSRPVIQKSGPPFITSIPFHRPETIRPFNSSITQVAAPASTETVLGSIRASLAPLVPALRQAGVALRVPIGSLYSSTINPRASRNLSQRSSPASSGFTGIRTRPDLRLGRSIVRSPLRLPIRHSDFSSERLEKS